MGAYDDSWARRTDESLADHRERIEHLEAEHTRTRRRLHDLESDRHAVRLLTRTLGELAERVKAMADGVDAIAETAVKKVLDAQRDSQRREWKHRMGIATGGAAIATAVLTIVQQLHIF